MEGKPTLFEPYDQNVKIWRYMNTAKFLSMVQNQILYFPRADRLGDPLEGSVTIPTSKLGYLLVEERERRKKLELMDLALEIYPDMSDEQIIHMHQQTSDMNKQTIKEVFVSCWHINDHESAAMWAIYGKENESIAIQSRYSVMTRNLPEWVWPSCVRYIDYDTDMMPMGLVVHPLVHKRTSFQYEAEVRFLAWSKLGGVYGEQLRSVMDEFALKVPIELKSTIETVFVSPHAPEWYFEIIKRIVSNYSIDVPVVKSSMIRDPIY